MCFYVVWYNKSFSMIFLEKLKLVIWFATSLKWDNQYPLTSTFACKYSIAIHLIFSVNIFSTNDYDWTAVIDCVRCGVVYDVVWCAVWYVVVWGGVCCDVTWCVMVYGGVWLVIPVELFFFFRVPNHFSRVFKKELYYYS